jgi:hypothetical protein
MAKPYLEGKTWSIRWRVRGQDVQVAELPRRIGEREDEAGFALSLSHRRKSHRISRLLNAESL